MQDKFRTQIVCAYLYPITKYGYPPPAKNTTSYLDEMSSLGFQTVELEGIREEHILSMYDQRELIREKINHLEISVPVYCTVLPHLSSQDDTVISRQLELFRRGCETARTIGASYILDNGPLPPYQFANEIPVTRHYEHELLSQASLPVQFNWDQFWEKLISTFQRVCDIAAEFDLTYLVHPAFGVLASTPEAFLHFYQSVNRKNLGYNFDTSNLIALKCNLSLAIKQLGAHIKYIHISDNRGIRNEHLPPGEGMINWSQFFKDLQLIKFDGYFGIDIGGDESAIQDLDLAYQKTAAFLEDQLLRFHHNKGD